MTGMADWFAFADWLAGFRCACGDFPHDVLPVQWGFERHTHERCTDCGDPIPARSGR